MICSNIVCELIDYENNKTYNQIIIKFFKNITGDNAIFNLAPANYSILNLNENNKILFITFFHQEALILTFGVSKVLSKNLTIENFENVYDQLENGNQKALDRFNCFMTDKRLTECFYLKSDFYTVIIFEDNFEYYNKSIILDNQSIPILDQKKDYSKSYHCIHLKEE